MQPSRPAGAGGLAGSQRPSGGSGPQPSSSRQTSLSAGLPTVDANYIRKHGSQIGPDLKILWRDTPWDPAKFGAQEEYDFTDAAQALRYAPKRPYRAPRRVGKPQLCSVVHGTGEREECPYGCKLCHFDRNRYIDRPTVSCAACDSAWCGACLQNRMGENIEEVPPSWLCPKCRCICNCSAKLCQRRGWGWQPTGQLANEARKLGYDSVSHYLIFARIFEQLNNGWQGEPVIRSGKVTEAGQRRVLKRPSKDIIPLPEAGPAAKRRKASEPVQREVRAVLDALGLDDLPTLFQAPPGLPLSPAGSPLGEGLGPAGSQSALAGLSAAELLEMDLARHVGEVGVAARSGRPQGDPRHGPLSASAPALSAPVGTGGASQQRWPQQPEARPTELPGAGEADFTASPPLLHGGPFNCCGAVTAVSPGSGHSTPFLPLRCLPPRRPRLAAAEHQLGRPAGGPISAAAPDNHAWAARPASLGTAAVPASMGAPAARSMQGPAAAWHARGPAAAAASRAEGEGSPDASHVGPAGAAPAPAGAVAAQPSEGELGRRQALEGLLHEDTDDWVHEGVPAMGGEQGAGIRGPPRESRVASVPPPPSQRHQQQQGLRQAHMRAHATQPSHLASKEQRAAAAAGATPREASREQPMGAAQPPFHPAGAPSGNGGGSAAAVSPDVADTSGQLKLSELSKGRGSTLAAGSAGARAGPGLLDNTASAGVAPGAAAAREASVHRASSWAGKGTSASAAQQAPAAAPASGTGQGAGATRAGPGPWFDIHAAILMTLADAHDLDYQYGTSHDPLELDLCDAALEDAAERLKQLADHAEGYLRPLEVSVAVHGPAAPGQAAVEEELFTASDPSSGGLSSLAELRMCLEVYKLLLEALPADGLPPLGPDQSAQQERREREARSHHGKIVRRLLAQEPFVDFGGSDGAARSLLLKAWLAALPVLHNKGLGSLVKEVVAEVGEAMARLALDLGEVCAVLDKVSKALELRQQDAGLPAHGFTVGAWKFDSMAPLHSEQMKWEGARLALTALLMWSLGQVHALCWSFQLGLASFGFLTERLVKAMLDPNAMLGSQQLRMAALRLFGTVFDGLLHRPWDQLNAIELAELGAVQQDVCRVVRRQARPLLENMVEEDNPCRRRGRPTAPAIGAQEVPRFAKVEALAVCYGYLLNHGVLGWRELEEEIARPYSSLSSFWLRANSLYRHLAVCMLYKAIEHAPLALREQPHATCALVAWVSALLESDGLIMAQQLTATLAQNQHTAQLFRSVTPQQIASLPDDSTGQVRAELLRTVANNISASLPWRPQLAVVLGSIDKMLGDRSKEVAVDCEDSNSMDRLLMWQNAMTTALVALLEAVPIPQGQAGLASELKKLLNRIAGWAMEACAALLREHADAVAAKASGPKGFGGAAGPLEEEEWKEPLVRRQLKGTVFGQLGSLWRLLEKWGAPGSLASDIELVMPVSTVVSACLEVCSGAEEANPVESVILKMLAESLASLPQRPSGQQGGQGLGPGQGLEPGQGQQPVQELNPLCRYVLATFVRRYLQRSSAVDKTDKHYNERAAVNALRFLQELLEESSMRSAGARLEALRPLLHPLLELMRPQAGPPSLAAKLAMYRLLGALFKGERLTPPPYIDLLSPDYAFQQARQLGLQQRQELQLQCFMTCLCQDVAECVAGAMAAGDPARAERQLKLVDQAATLRPDPALPRALQPPSRARDKWGLAVNQLIAMLEAAPSLSLIKTAYSDRGVEQLVAKLIASSAAVGEDGGGGVAPGAAAPRPGQFQPERLHWPLADQALGLVRTLAQLPQEQSPAFREGPAWAMTTFSVLHVLLLSPTEETKRRRALYNDIRSALEQRFGSAIMARFRLGKQQQQRPAGAAAALPARQVVPPGQPSQQQQQQQQSQSISQPAQQQRLPASRAASGDSGTQQAAPGGKKAAATTAPEPRDVPLAALSAMPQGSLVNVLALLCAAPIYPKAEAGMPPVALLKLRDFAGGQTVDVVAKLQGAGLVQRAVQLANSARRDWARPLQEPLVLRLSHLQLEAGGTCRSTDKTRVEQPPRTDTAACQLARAARALASPIPAPAAEAQAPSPSVGSIRPGHSPPRQTQQHGVHSVPTREFHFSQALPGPSAPSVPAAPAAGKRPSNGAVPGDPKRQRSGGSGAGAAVGGSGRAEQQQQQSQPSQSVLSSGPRPNLADDPGAKLARDALKRVLAGSKGSGQEYSREEVTAVLKEVIHMGEVWKELKRSQDLDKLVRMVTHKLRENDLTRERQRQLEVAMQSQAV